jgi:hypothetical protein
MFREGIDGFTGGLSAENYITITGTSRATATRDFQDLVEKGALARVGELRHTAASSILRVRHSRISSSLSFSDSFRGGMALELDLVVVAWLEVGCLPAPGHALAP